MFDYRKCERCRAEYLPAKTNPIAHHVVNGLLPTVGSALLLARREPERGVYRPLIRLRVWR